MDEDSHLPLSMNVVGTLVSSFFLTFLFLCLSLFVPSDVDTAGDRFPSAMSSAPL